MGYGWFRLDSSVCDHPKVLRLVAELGDPLAGWYFIRLLCWTERYAPDGIIPASIVGQVEAALAWRGESGRLLAALQLVGLLDPRTDGFEVHDWDEKNGALVEKARRDAALKRKERRENGAKTARAGRADGACSRARGDVTRRDETKGGEKAAPVSPPASSDSRPGEFRERMDAIFAEERGGARPRWLHEDEDAVAELLGLGDYETIYRFWRNGLRRKKYPSVNRVAELAKHWNACATAEPGARSGEPIGDTTVCKLVRPDEDPYAEVK